MRRVTYKKAGYYKEQARKGNGFFLQTHTSVKGDKLNRFEYYPKVTRTFKFKQIVFGQKKVKK